MLFVISGEVSVGGITSPQGIWGLCVHNLDQASIDAVVDLQVEWVRIEFSREFIQVVDGPFWEEHDHFMQSMFTAGVQVLGQITHTPTDIPWTDWEEQYPDIQAFTTDVVNRYRPGGVLGTANSWGDYGVTHWMAFNEPNLPGSGWLNVGDDPVLDIDKYCDVLAIVYDAIKSIMPGTESTVLVGGLSYNLDLTSWLTTFYATNPTPRFNFDALAVHPYGSSNLHQTSTSLRLLMGSLGENPYKPLWFDEFGSDQTELQISLLRTAFAQRSAAQAVFWSSLTDPPDGQSYGLIEAVSGQHRRLIYEEFKALTATLFPGELPPEPEPFTATFSAALGPFVEEVASGTLVGTVAINDSWWEGTYSVNAPFEMSGDDVVVGDTPLSAGSYTITGAATGENDSAAYSSEFFGSLTVAEAGISAAVGTSGGSGDATAFTVSEAVGEASGVGDAVALVPDLVSAAVGDASGIGDATATVGAAVTTAGVGSAGGVGAAVAQGRSTIRRAGVASGVGAAVAQGRATRRAAGTAGGVGAASATGTTVVTSFTPAIGPFAPPLASATVVGAVTGSAPYVVNSPFAMSGTNVVVGGSPLSAGTYAVTGTANGIAFSGSINVAAVPTAAMAVVITYGAITATYDIASATNKGDYIDPEGDFVQRCYLAPRQDGLLPGFTVWFRPDATTSRREIVFELGVMTGMTAIDMTAYTAAIYVSGSLVTTLSVPRHIRFSRWRWQSAARPIRKTTAELSAAKLIPTFSNVGLGTWAARSEKTYTIMGLAGIEGAMGLTSDRPDIGVITGQQADYVILGALESTILAQAEAMGTVNMHVRDLSGGYAPLDINANPMATMSTATINGKVFVERTRNNIVDGDLLNYDTGHSPASSYLPFLLTGDPYFLEALQFQANMDLLVEPPASRFKANGRYLAWSLRNSLYASVSTPTSVPSWLRSQSYFDGHVAKYRALGLHPRIAETDNALHLVASGGSQNVAGFAAGSYCAPWQEDMLMAVLALAVRLGFTEFMPELLWKLDCSLSRLSTDPDVWQRQNCSPYNISFLYACVLGVAMGTTDTTITVDSIQGVDPWPAMPFQVTVDTEVLTVTARVGTTWTVTRSKVTTHNATRPLIGRKYTSWNEAFARNFAVNPQIFDLDPLVPSGLRPKGVYIHYLRGGLAMAIAEGATIAETPYAWLHSEVVRITKSSWHSDTKWMMVPD